MHVSTFLAYVQQTGRAGRTGSSCVAVVYYNMEDIGRRTVTTEMREFCLNSDCRRQFIAEHFGYGIEQVLLKHDCCDNCERQCQCEYCNISKSVEELTMPITIGEEKQLTCDEVYYALINLFDMLSNTGDDLINPALTTGLSSSLATVIACQHRRYTDQATLSRDHSHLSQDIVNYIYQIIEHFHKLDLHP